ncbi:MAG: heavy metal translocating P-type ATPase [Candidatus Angelobacter sp.]|jgi:heavy metal translocating P-type ATPase|nr:heavy metal translocating P-type ATPase [Candidatus Angelobacter sp.]
MASNQLTVHTNGATHEHKHPEAHDQELHDHGFEWEEAVRIGLVALAAGLVWFRVWEPFAKISVIGVVGTLIGIYPILKEAAENVMERRMTMELSMTIAILAALAIGQFFTALVIVLFVLIAEVLEGLTVRRGRTAIKQLLDFLPREVTVRRSGATVRTTAETIIAGEIVEVNPGGRIPVDGIVTGGNSFVDQSTITGESMPAEKIAGAQVYAGTMNQSGALQIQVTGIGRDTAFGRIVQAVEQAERSRAPIQKTADKLAGYLVWFALGCAALTFVITRNLTSTISVIIVAGACGIAAGTPLAILGGIGRAARQGAIIKGGLYLEALSSVQIVVFDKTGTLTFGDPEVAAVVPADGRTEQEVLTFAAIAERRSEHPLAKAILKCAIAGNIAIDEPEQFQYLPGRGITCSSGRAQIVAGNRGFLEEHGIALNGASSNGIGSEVFLATNGAYVGSILIADRLRPEAKDAVAALHKMGLRTALLTGDSRQIADAVAKEVGIDTVYAEVLPHEKQKIIRDLRNKGERVAMVGDGVNDAPALMEATVGIAMGSGTDVARESANIMLIGNDLLRLVETVQIARRCNRVIMQNFTGTLAVDAVGVALAALGMLNPLFAAFIHVSSELAFILNSARLLPAAKKIGQ